MKGSRGFTLIELLVVIAIIAILAAILFPVFATARQKAQQTSCLSNMKQNAMALLMYVDDQGLKFPLSWPNANPDLNPPTFDTGPWPPWYMAVREYQPQDKALKCPSARDVVGYGFNLNMVERPIGEIIRPEDKVLLTEIRTTTLVPTWQWGWGATISPPQDGDWPYNDFPARHNGRINVAFVGGNVGAYKLYYNWDPVRPNRANVLPPENWY